MDVEIILQGKGGVGKSLIASLLAQYFSTQGEPPLCLDTDPVNATFSGYKAFDVETLNIMDGDDINPRTFDQLIERIMTADAGRMIIDNGASTFVPLCSYLLQNDVAALLQEGGHNVRLHSVITGGQALPDTIEGFSSLCRNIGAAPVVVWLNEYFGKPVHNGKTFEESKVFEKNRGRVHSLVTIPAVKPETFGQDMHKMLTRRITFDEAEVSKDFSIMERQRLRMMKRTLFATPLNRQRLALLVRSMLGDAGQSDGIEDVLSHVVETAFHLPVEARSFNEIYPLTFPADTDAKKAFARWVTDSRERAGLYASTFNAPRDSLAGVLSQSFMTGINMNEALEDPNLGPPVVAHIASAIERLAREGRSKGFAIFIDEAAKLLRNPAFCDLAAEMYREYRKFGGAVGMAFQDPGALHKSGIADAVIENTASFFFFPNPQGNRSAYEPFNLNDEHKGFIFGAPEGRKVLLVKRDAATGFEESAILDVDLAPLGKPVRFYRSGPDAVRDLLAIQEKWGDAWPAHI